MKARCCEEGILNISSWKSNEWYLDYHEVPGPIKFCPYCGTELDAPADLPSLLKAIEAYDGPPLHICFDVDGLLAVEFDEYSKRGVFSESVEVLKKLKACGHTIVVQTARYMGKFDGDQQKATQAGHYELKCWLDSWEIPYDAIFLGKAGCHIYLDDRGCRIEAMRGITQWTRNFLPALRAHANAD